MLSLKLGRFIVGLSKRVQNFQFFVFNIFSQDLFSLFLFFPWVVYPPRLRWFILQEFGFDIFRFVSREANDTSPKFHLINFGFLDYHSRQIGCHRLINYHTNVILTVSLSHMNLVKANI